MVRTLLTATAWWLDWGLFMACMVAAWAVNQ